MIYTNFDWKDELGVQISAAVFGANDAVTEIHASAKIVNTTLTTNEQFKNITTAIELLQKKDCFKNTDLIWKRYFLSDATNQYSHLTQDSSSSISSVVQQPPLNGSKVAVWLYFAGGNNKTEKVGDTLSVKRNDTLKHLYTTQLNTPLKNEYKETELIFKSYTDTLKHYNSTLKDNCIRTWIYVQGVDIHYQEMVKARVAIFEKENLNRETHYLASTGIEGKHVNPQSLVLMDAYAIEGVQQEQIKFLHAPSHLNRTHDYGVTFERGTSVDFSDRRHVYISGTASIDNQGEIVYPNDIKKQLDRTLENIGVLLSEADCNMKDIAHMIVYLRDIADYTLVKDFFDRNYTSVPKVIVLAPVCRPGWLIEIECIAIKNIENNNYPSF